MDLRFFVIFINVSMLYAKQKQTGCKKVQGQSEATLQTGRRDQNSEAKKLKIFLTPRIV